MKKALTSLAVFLAAGCTQITKHPSQQHEEDTSSKITFLLLQNEPTHKLED